MYVPFVSVVGSLEGWGFILLIGQIINFIAIVSGVLYVTYQANQANVWEEKGRRIVALALAIKNDAEKVLREETQDLNPGLVVKLKEAVQELEPIIQMAKEQLLPKLAETGTDTNARVKVIEKEIIETKEILETKENIQK